MTVSGLFGGARELIINPPLLPTDAHDHGLRGFSVYQGRWSAAERDFEREIVPMAQAEGMALIPWGALGGGYFKTEDQQRRSKSNDSEGRQLPMSETPAHLAVSSILERISKAKKVPLTSVALAYVMHKAPYVFPVVGGRKVNHLRDNIDALGLALDEEEIAAIETATAFDIGFPLNFLTLKKDPGHLVGPGDMWMSKTSGHHDYMEPLKPIRPKS